MCQLGSDTEWIQVHKRHSFPRKPMRTRVRVLGLSRRNRRDEEDMELKNLKLYMENMSIIQENERLKKQAGRLREEKIALMSEFQNRFPINKVNEKM